jgi:RNA polymerase sigma-70 factor (ECF subfamily)
VGLQPNDAADVCQETLLAVASSLKNFRHDRPGSSFRGWLWTVTHSKIHDLFRRQQKQARAQGGTAAQERLQEIPEGSSDGSVTGSPEEDSGPEHRAIEFVRAAVEDRTWEAFWRVTVEGQRIADVAAELGMTEHAVYDAKYRVRRLVLRELRDLIA